MATLTETPTYEPGVYQLETSDPARGGSTGVLNLPLKHLANRTAWLKANVDALAAGKYPASGGILTGNVTVQKATPSLVLDATGLTVGGLRFYRDGVQRWAWQAWNDADPTLYLSAFDSGGAVVGNVISVDNVTRQVSIIGTAAPNLPAADPTTANQAARKAYVDAKDVWSTIADTALTAVAQIDTTWTAGAYRVIQVHLLNIGHSRTQDTAEQLLCRLRAGGGGFIASGYTLNGLEIVNGVQNSYNFGSLNNGSIRGAGASATTDRESGTITLYLGPAGEVTHGIVQHSHVGWNGAPANTFTARSFRLAGQGAAIDGIRLFWNSGSNFQAAGRILVQGLKA